MDRGKLYSCSLIRFIAMILIISCHTCEWIGYALGESTVLGIVGNWCAVGVQIFLILSGFLYGRRGNLFQNEKRIDFVIRNVKKIILDYFVYAVFVILPVYCYGKEFPQIFKMLFRVFTFSGVIDGVHHLWFIPYILVCYLFTPLLYDIKQKAIDKNCLMSSLFLLWVIIEIFDIAYNSYFVGTWIMCYVVGFFSPEIIIKFSNKAKAIIMAGVVLALPVNYVGYITRYVVQPLVGKGLKNEICVYIINYARSYNALIIVLFIMFICSRRPIRNSIWKKVLDLSDKFSFDIYITHMIYIKGALSLLNKTRSYAINVLFMLIATVLSGVILFYICEWIRKHTYKIYK